MHWTLCSSLSLKYIYIYIFFFSRRAVILKALNTAVQQWCHSQLSGLSFFFSKIVWIWINRPKTLVELGYKGSWHNWHCLVYRNREKLFLYSYGNADSFKRDGCAKIFMAIVQNENRITEISIFYQILDFYFYRVLSNNIWHI